MRDKTAYWLAMVAAIAMVVIGAIAVVADSDVLNPSSKTTVTTGPTPEIPGTRRTTTEVVQQRGKAPKTTKTVEDQSPAPARPKKVVSTTQEGERSFTERVLGDGGLIVLQIGAIVLAAFLVAALLQRLVLGQYAIKLGSFELPAAAVDTTADGLEALGTKIDEVEARGRADEASVRDDLVLLYRRLDLIERELRS